MALMSIFEIVIFNPNSPVSHRCYLTGESTRRNADCGRHCCMFDFPHFTFSRYRLATHTHQEQHGKIISFYGNIT